MLRARHNLWVSTYGFRVGRLEVTSGSYGDRVVEFLWYRRPRNFVRFFRYGPEPLKLKEARLMSNQAMDRYRQFERDGKVDQVPDWPSDAPEGIPPANACVDEMLARLCQFINGFEGDYQMEPGQFYQRTLLAAYQTYYWVVAVEVYDGDDGGSSVLTAYWDLPITGAEGTSKIQYMLHEFDSMLTVITDAGTLCDAKHQNLTS